MIKNSRAKKGILVSIVGIVTNIILSSVKISIGLIAGSISVLLDGFNNFTDIFTSGATAFAFGVSDMKSHEKYPNGYGRIEYIISLLISIIVIVIGISFLFSAVERILVPTPVGFSWIYFYILAITVVIKLVLGIFFHKSNKNLCSLPIKVLCLDSFQDAGITAFVLLTFGLSRVTAFPLDAVCAMIMALIIFVNCGKLAAKSFKLLLGKENQELKKNIIDFIKEKEYIFQIENFRIHDYGHGNLYGNATVYIDGDWELKRILENIKELEKEINNKFKMKINFSIDI